MFCINLATNDPFFNLAIEEILLINSKEDYLILGINAPSAIIGKHQSAHKEVNIRFLTENNIPVIRRISGGGTVFHDSGNLNFTFIRECEPGKQVDFQSYTRPVIDFLCSLGINAKFEGKNDIKVDGLKISGNAEHIHRNRVLHHGTLLFSAALERMKNSLRADKSCYTTRAVESNPSSVMNLNDKLGVFADIDEFRAGLMNYVLNDMPDVEQGSISHQQEEDAASLAKSKYGSWEWNFAYGPEYTFSRSFLLRGENISCTLFVKDGIILKCNLIGNQHMRSVARELTGCRHMADDMMKVFQNENIFLSDEEIYCFF